MQHASRRAAAVVALTIAASTAVAYAAPPRAEQVKCILHANASSVRVARAQAKTIARCLRLGFSGRLTPGATIDTCVSGAVSGAVASRISSAVAKAEKRCADLPSFGFTGVTVAAGVAIDEEVALARSVFGDELLGSGHGSTWSRASTVCGVRVHKAYERLLAAKLRQFQSCKKRGLGEARIDSTTGLAACLAEVASAPDARVSRLRARLAERVQGTCTGSAMIARLTLPCPQESDAAVCVARSVDCHACRLLDAADDLSVDCDMYDNGSADRSCARGRAGPTTSTTRVVVTTSVTQRAATSTIAVPPTTVAAATTTTVAAVTTTAPVQPTTTLVAPGPVCGDGVAEGDEECDDANGDDTDCCLSTCMAAATGSACADDGNVCTDDVCDDAGACEHPANMADCDDGLFCTAVDVCSDGVCTGATDPCTGGDECTDACDEAADSCARAAGTPCGGEQTCLSHECDGNGGCVAVPAPGVDVVGFEGLAEGAIVSEVFAAGGLGPIGVSATNPALGGANAAIIFRSDCPGSCSGGDSDLGTPNEEFGGPGSGEGGEPGSAFPNQVALGNVLIVAQDLVDGNGDGRVDDPDDEDMVAVRMEFDLSAIAPVAVLGITVLDSELVEPAPLVELYDGFGQLVASFELPQTGNNGVAASVLEPVEGATSMIVHLDGSAAIDEIVLGTPCDDGDPCTAPDACDGAGACVGEALDCSSLDGPCRVGVCDAALGACVHEPAFDGGSCDDGDDCTVDDVCDDGQCVGAPVDCPGGESCCDGACFDLDSDVENCGRCGRDCDDDEECVAARCEPVTTTTSTSTTSTSSTSTSTSTTTSSSTTSTTSSTTSTSTSSTTSSTTSTSTSSSSTTSTSTTSTSTTSTSTTSTSTTSTSTSTTSTSTTSTSTSTTSTSSTSTSTTSTTMCVPDCAGRTCGDDGCGGTCGPDCGGFSECCDGICVVLNTEQHCGACGTDCGPDGECCTSNPLLPGVCRNIQSDDSNCGGCGIVCERDIFFGLDEACCDGMCSNTESDPDNCGGCGIQCGAGEGCCDGVCTDLTTNDRCGSCGTVCGLGRECCDQLCAPLDEDESNCGGCGITCDAGEACCGGVCQADVGGDDPSSCGPCGVACGAGEGCCNGTCTALGSISNCSACGDTCNFFVGEQCCNGQCATFGTTDNCQMCGDVCDAGEECCGVVGCRDTQFDASNCGSCGNDCNTTPFGDNICCDGVCLDDDSDENNCGGCGIQCAAGEQCCDGVCLDLSDDPGNCGGCGISCGAGGVCCDGTCENVDGDADNCGGCGIQCGAGESCCGGTCVSGQGDPSNCCGIQCAAGEGCCDGRCTDLIDDGSNCGACGTQCDLSDEACCDGACTTVRDNPDSCGSCTNSCSAGEDCCGTICQDLQTSTFNCGECGQACLPFVNPNLRCCQGMCIDSTMDGGLCD